MSAPTFFRRVIDAAKHPRPWLTVSAQSPLGRLVLTLRRDQREECRHDRPA